ncbi:MAG: DUF2207 domain-containing protein [Desulfuromonas sp.]|nr:MAG: DUF2207 domain-containing protein [Desulfuromonas sp.]
MKGLLTVLLLFLSVSPLWAEERILDFSSDIQVFVDGSMEVTETVRVRAENREIKRGIYRDFPTDYKDRFGNRYRVGFDVVAVSRDGRSEAWHIKRQGDGVRVYLGRKEHVLRPGVYSYQLTYRTNRQLGFFDDHDELYWNVTGNDWTFPIDRVEARVVLPEEIPAERLVPEAYTGPRGAQGTDYTVEIGVDGVVEFFSSRPFVKQEGMTIVVSWPKGYISQPSLHQEVGYLLNDNLSLVVCLIGLIVLLCYYLLSWLLVGRDPQRGVVITRYQPPTGFSPASARFIERMGYDHKAFASALVNLAVKGFVEITEEDGEYTLTRTSQRSQNLSPGEQAILKGFFNLHNYGSIPLERSRHKKISKVLKAHEQALKLNYEKLYFVSNRRWLIPGLFLSLLLFAATIKALPDAEMMASGAFLSLWLTIWTFGVFTLGKNVVQAWRNVQSSIKVVGALMVTLFALPFFAAEVVVIGMLATQVSPALPLALVGAILLSLLFYHLLKAPTRAGRRLLDEVEGFRDFLDVAEREEMDFRNPPEKTPELFERYLPYALALGVEQRWMERFAALFQRMEQAGSGYRPAWYHGQSWNVHDLGTFSGSIGGALSSAISSSSTAPGSSSGSGGGGSSGGGGGGGGGGGW